MSTQVSYPPLPPNCPILSGGDFDWPDTFHWDLNTPYSARPIIAAVARCAWLDEMERIHPGGCTNCDKDPWPKAWRDAAANAEAWRKWGKSNEAPAN